MIHADSAKEAHETGQAAFPGAPVEVVPYSEYTDRQRYIPAYNAIVHLLDSVSQDITDGNYRAAVNALHIAGEHLFNLRDYLTTRWHEEVFAPKVKP